MVDIWRTFDPIPINEIMNHPDVRPWLSDEPGYVDMAWKMARQDIVTVLMGDHGAFTAYKLLPGVYEFHTQILPEGRGKWAREFAEAGLLWMFTKTDAYELLTRVPENHRGALFAARAMGLRQDFVDHNQFQYQGEMVSSLIHSIRIQDWAAAAPAIEAAGQMLHEKIDEIGTNSGVIGTIWPETHEDCPAHNRYLGAAYHCALGGQLGKGVLLYNRWLLASHVNPHLQAKVISCEPPKIWLYHAEITLFPNGDFDITPESGKCLKQQLA